MGVGPTQIEASVRAIALSGLRNRDDFYWALAGSLITRPEQRALFDQAFDLFWRTQSHTEKVAELTVWRRDDKPASSDNETDLPLHLLAESPAVVSDDFGGDAADQRDSAADAEHLGEKQFDQMTADELAAAKQQLAQLPFETARFLGRRRERHSRGDAIDWRRSFRSLTRGALPRFAYSRRREESPTVVVLCDISGSMQIYSRVLLHFVCALAQRRARTHAFLFGTRLTNISRLLGVGDIDAAVARICTAARDFDGGTRIGAALGEFNRLWSRRLLGRHAIVVLVSDGLEGEDSTLLELEIARLHRSCKRLMWLNPLLRYAGFEPKASGVKAILGHVDSLHAMHNLRHLGDVALALGKSLHTTAVNR